MIKIQHRPVITSAAKFAVNPAMDIADPKAVPGAIPFPFIVVRTRPALAADAHEVFRDGSAKRDLQRHSFLGIAGDSIRERAVEFQSAVHIWCVPLHRGFALMPEAN